MALYVRDNEVDRLAGRVAALHRVSKTEAVRRALIHELECEGGATPLVERGMAFARQLHLSAGQEQALVVGPPRSAMASVLSAGHHVHRPHSSSPRWTTPSS